MTRDYYPITVEGPNDTCLCIYPVERNSVDGELYNRVAWIDRGTQEIREQTVPLRDVATLPKKWQATVLGRMERGLQVPFRLLAGYTR